MARKIKKPKKFNRTPKTGKKPTDLTTLHFSQQELGMLHDGLLMIHNSKVLTDPDMVIQCMGMVKRLRSHLPPPPPEPIAGNGDPQTPQGG